MPNDEQPPEPTAMQDTPRHVELSEKLAEHMKALVPELTAERLSKQKRIATALSRQPWLLEEYESLQSRLEAAEGENGRLERELTGMREDFANISSNIQIAADQIDWWKRKAKDENEQKLKELERVSAITKELTAAESRAQQAEEMRDRAIAALELSAAPECSCQFQCQPNCPAMLYYAARKAALSSSPPSDRTDENQPTTKPQ